MIVFVPIGIEIFDNDSVPSYKYKYLPISINRDI